MKKHLWKRVLSMVLLVCMLVGIFPAGVSATEEAVDRRAGSTMPSQEVLDLMNQIAVLKVPQYTHNEKHHWDTDSDWGYGKWYKMPEGVTGAYIFVNAETGYAINPVYDSSGKWFKSTQTTTDGDSVYGVGLDASHGLTLVCPNNSELANYTDHGCYCIQVPNGKYISAKSTGFNFVDYNNIYYNLLVRDYAVFIEAFFDSVSHCYVSDSTGTKMDAAANNNAANASKKNTFYMYRLKTLPGLTELYDAIKDADWYLDGGSCGEEQYAQLLTELRQSVDLYKQSNTYQTNKTSAQVKELDYDLKEQAIALKEAVENVRMTMEVTDLAARVTAQIATLTQPGTYNKLVDLREQQSENNVLSTDVPLNALQKGGYLAILHRNSSYSKYNHRAEYYLIDGTVGGEGSVVSGKKVQIDNNSILGDNSAQFLKIEHRGSNASATSSQQIKFTDGNYLLRTPDANAEHLVIKGQKNNTSTDAGLDQHYVFSYSPDGRHVVFYNPNGHALSFDGSNFKWTSYYRDNLGKNSIKFYFFRQWSTTDLYQVIKTTMAPELSKITEYTEGNFRHLLNCYERCIRMYKLANDVYPKADILSDEIFTTTMEDLIDELKSCQRLRSAKEYIDIPVEMLDFRADGFLFEANYTFRSAYSMSFETKPIYDANGNEVAPFPGVVKKGENWTENSYQYSIKQLIEDHLVNGKIAYREETVNYIAHALYQAKLQNATSDSSNPERVRNIAPIPLTMLQQDANKVFIQWHQETLRELGTWEDSLAKDGGQNGGKMTWDDVETYYDMAYYMLTYLWQRVPETSGNVLETRATNSYAGQDLYYNMVVPERNTMRMYKEKDKTTGVEYYYFGSDIGHSYADGVMYNNGLSRLSGSPSFNPVREVGYADETYFGNRTTGATYLEKDSYRTNANFYFTMHAHGSFIYYEDSDLYFDFAGDDDVYFFIKDTLVCDLGGIHGSPREVIYLNDINKSMNLGLKNGDVCNFDMFYGDRHTGNITLNLKTNIQIMNEDVLTSKGQYGEILNGISQTDKYGVGTALANNALVNIGAQIAYSFDLLNKGAVPVDRMTFIDSSLGVSLSPDSVNLGNATANGIETKIGDLILFYRSTEGTAVDGSDPVDISYTQLLDMIDEANNFTLDGTQPVFGTFPQGSYRLGSVTVDQLKTLLDLGLPRNCQISIYGFKRITKASDYPNYQNTLETVCYDAYVGGSALRGTATRYLQVPDMNAPNPTADEEHLVVDYGKAVHIPIAELRAHIYDNAKAQVGKFVGLSQEEDRYNGEPLRYAPADLCTDSVQGTFGSFTITDSSIMYKPDKFLTETETIYGVFALSGYHGYSAGGDSFEYRYIVVKIRITPASVMYYEAEDFVDAQDKPIDTLIYENGTDKGDWGQVADEVIPMDLDRENIPEDALFFDFDGTGHAKRYRDNPIYDSIDFDYVESWYKNSACVSGHAIQDGALKLTFNENLTIDYRYIQSVVPGVTVFDKDNPLRFKTSADHYVQVRFRLTDCVRKHDGNMYFTLYFSDGANPNDNINGTYTSDNRNYAIKSIDVDKALSGEYVTMLLPLSKTSFYTGADFIDAVRMQIDNVNPVPGKTGVIEFDYLYVGPYVETKQDLSRTVDTVYDMQIDRESIPADAFFADFDGDGYDARYKNDPQYNGLNFDLADYWWSKEGSTDSIATTVDTKAGTLTLKVTDFNNSGGYGAYLGTGMNGTYPTVNSVNDLPLNYIPTDHDFVELRFKVENCQISGGWVQFLYTYEKADGTVGYQEINGCDFTTSENGKYQTLTFPLREYTNYYSAKRIRSFAFRFRNIRSNGNADARVVIDYIYVGSELGLPEDLHQDYLFFDFTDTESDRIRYSSSAYGNSNMDLAQNGVPTYWTGRTQDFKLGTAAVANGEITVQPNTIRSGGYNSIYAACNEVLHYNASNAEVFQMRFKAKNLNGTSPTATIHFYNSAGTLLWNTTVPFDKNYLTNNTYITVTGEIGSNLRSCTDVEKITLWVGNLTPTTAKTGVLTIDYAYIGPKAQLDRMNLEREKLEQEAAATNSPAPMGLPTPNQEYLYFGFDNADADKLRYSNPVYGGKNYDGTASNWKQEFNTAEITNGVMRLKPKGHADGWATIATATALNYVPHPDDYLQARIRIVNGTAKGTAEFGFYYGNEAGVTVNNSTGVYLSAADVASGNWFTISTPLNNAPYNWSKDQSGDFTTFEKINYIRPMFSLINVSDTTYFEIDYIYIGPMVESNPAQKSLFFDFDDQPGDYDRYNTDVYGYIQYDRTGSNQETDQWYSYSKKIESLTVDPASGTMKIIAKGKLPEHGTSTSYEDTDVYPDVYFDTVMNGYDSYPLDYKPDQAMVCQIRFKMKNFRTTTYINADGKEYQVATPYLNLQYFPDGTNSNHNVVVDKSFDAKHLNSNEYITVTLPLDGEQCETMRNFASINRFRFFFGGMESISESQKGEVVIDYIYVGPGEIPPTVYGYDSSYLNDASLSNGESLFVEGKGVKLNNTTTTYTETKFTFKGTGVDLISRTGKNQATIRVNVYAASDLTKAVKSLTVNQKGELELKQIPTVSIQGLPYGEYVVTVGVNKAILNSVYDFLNRGGEFYLDAIRIYDPIDITGTDLTTQEQDALDAYKFHKEAYAHVKEVRNILLSAQDFDALTVAKDGAVFVDVKSFDAQPDGAVENTEIPTTTVIDDLEDVFPDVNVNGNIALDVLTYNKIGPKNEVYLAPKQAVAFKLQIDSTRVPESLDVGVKIIDGSTAHLAAGIVSGGTTEGVLTVAGAILETIDSATAQYYPLSLDADHILKDTAGSKYVYVVIYNNSVDRGTDTDQVLSITDVKVAYATEPNAVLPEDSITDPEVRPWTKSAATAAPVRFMVDDSTKKAVEVFLQGLMETPLDVPTVAEGIKIGHSLNLASDISINYAVSIAQLEGYEDMTLHCTLPVYEGNVQIGTNTVVLQPVENGSYYYFTLNGLTAINMNDVIEARLSMTKDGKTYVSDVDTYSIAHYAYSQLNKSAAKESLKTLCAELLRYGAKAQIYKAYRTDALVDGNMTEEHKAYLSDIEAVTFGNTNQTDNIPQTNAVELLGKSLDLASKVSIKFIFSLGSYTGSPEDLSMKVTYKDIFGKDKELILSEIEVYSESRGYYAFTLDALLGAELRSVLTVQILSGDTVVSGTVQYAADTYGNGKSGALLDLCKALFAYSDSAKLYFAD